MKNLSEICELYLPELNESLLGGRAKVKLEAEKFIDEEVIKTWAVNPEKFKIYKQKKGFFLDGDCVIDNYEDAEYVGPIIKHVRGNLTIKNSKLKNLKGLFYNDGIDVTITGTFTLEDNDNLETLKYIPNEVGSLVVSCNKNIKEIDTMTHVFNNAYFFKNGKRFNKDKVAEKINVAKNIFCSTNDSDEIIIESMINEAVKSPQLLLIINALKEARTGLRGTVKEKEYLFTLNELCEIQWDKLSGSCISEMDINDPKAKTQVRSYISGKTSGLICIMNKEGEIIYIIRGQTCIPIKDRSRGLHKHSDHGRFNNISNGADFIFGIQKYHWDETAKGADTLIFVDLSEVDRTFEIQRERKEAKKDAIALKRGNENLNPTSKHVRYYKEIAMENRRRYEQLLKQIKLNKGVENLSKNFENIKDRIDRAFDRYTKLLSKVLNTPEKYSTSDINSLNYSFGVGNSNYGTDGLFQVLKTYTELLIDVKKGTYYRDSANLPNHIKEIEIKITNRLVTIEDKLKELENK